MPKLWKPGESGNPNGRPPKNRALSDLLRVALSHKGEDGITLRVAMTQKLAEMAAAGDLDAIKVVLERIDGKVPDTLNLNHKQQVVKAIDAEAWDSV